MQNRKMEIDVIGQYYASINNVKQTGVFALNVYLNELIQAEKLQQAADDMMRRLPFLNGRLVKGCTHCAKGNKGIIYENDSPLGSRRNDNRAVKPGAN